AQTYARCRAATRLDLAEKEHVADQPPPAPGGLPAGPTPGYSGGPFPISSECSLLPPPRGGGGHGSSSSGVAGGPRSAGLQKSRHCGVYSWIQRSTRSRQGRNPDGQTRSARSEWTLGDFARIGYAVSSRLDSQLP